MHSDRRPLGAAGIRWQRLRPSQHLVDVPWVKAVINHHTTPEEAGVVFSRTKPRMAVFSHITLVGDADNPRPGDKDIEARTRTTWSGSLVVGTDLTRFVLRADGPSMKRFDHTTGSMKSDLGCGGVQAVWRSHHEGRN